MHPGIIALQIALAIAVPFVTVWLEPRFKAIRIISPVVICYLTGMLLGNLPFMQLSDGVSLGMANVTVALAIPLLLFSVDVVAWLRLARSTIIGFCIAIVAAMTATIAVHMGMGSGVIDSPKIAGMLSGVYIGGTPNMAAIATAVDARPETFILLNAADMVVSFGYLLFMLMVAPRVLRFVLPAFRFENGSSPDEPAADEKPRRTAEVPPLKDGALAMVLAVVMVLAGVGIGRFAPELNRDTVIILAITTFAVGASLVARVRGLQGSQDMGQFLLLIFCVAMGFTTDFVELFTGSPMIILYATMVVLLIIVLHIILSALFRIDRDTAIITSAAGVFGPHMIGPVAMVLGNREIVFSGIASGLVGLALGNYLGLSVVWMLT